MTQKERTNLFNLCVILYNIFLGLFIEMILVAVLFLFLQNKPELGENVSIQVMLPILLLIGLIVAMSISVKTVSWAITKFNLQNKLDPKVVSKYCKNDLKN